MHKMRYSYETVGISFEQVDLNGKNLFLYRKLDLH